jgi:hypothetical protein
MPKINKTAAAVSVDQPVIQIRSAELGEYTVGFETHRADADPAPLFVGLPGDRCQCPHWGVVLSGRMVFRYADHDEEYVAGDAYYGAPGHLPLLFAGTEVVEFSPTEALAATMTVLAGNMAAADSEAAR